MAKVLPTASDTESIANPTAACIRSCSLGADRTDLGMSRTTGNLVPKKADLWDNFVAIFSVATYFTDLVTDALVAHKYFSSGDWWWFSQTVVFIVVPSVILQVLSCKWYLDDSVSQMWWDWLLHFLQLGPVKRYFSAFWYGLQTWCTDEVDIKHYKRYLTEWRDITMLHLLEGFTEAGPQMILQLYVLATLGRPFSWKSDWKVTASAATSVTSLAWALVSYTHAQRVCVKQKGLSICGYVFQTGYRVCIVSSRVLILVLFAWEYKLWIYLVCSAHWLAMLVWLRQYPTRFCSAEGEPTKIWFERFFSGLVAFIYIFCFINTIDSTSRQRVSLYYFIFFVENTSLIVLWYMRRKAFGWMEYTALIVICGGFFLGLACMLCYHKFFHPSQDITEGWLCCRVCQGHSTDDSSFQDVRVLELREPVLSNDHDTPRGSALQRSASTPDQIYVVSNISQPVSPYTSRDRRRMFSSKSQRSVLQSIISRSNTFVPVDVELTLRSAISDDNLYRVVSAGSRQDKAARRKRTNFGTVKSFSNVEDAMHPEINNSGLLADDVVSPSANVASKPAKHLRVSGSSSAMQSPAEHNNPQLISKHRHGDRGRTLRFDEILSEVRSPGQDVLSHRAVQLVTYV